ncbi:hypothetical protein LTR37_001298 [Vermiconidia calcicola]|uniref:Uncharacterized protein n=1 Tax=Vermiconidia calcicola TaxID=1690605 RepID=A0ACC3NWN8_9PEZI|nr:hypothetical protein LTR37_001298 [Vermiconidia calcicola]
MPKPTPSPYSLRAPSPSLPASDVNLAKLYGPYTYNAATLALHDRHKVHEAALADHFYSTGEYSRCQELCYEILQAEPSEAIRARCHMYLATEGVGSEFASVRAYHAACAVAA